MGTPRERHLLRGVFAFLGPCIMRGGREYCKIHVIITAGLNRRNTRVLCPNWEA